MSLTDRLPYYPRENLLESVLRMIIAGANVTLFAPRRQGKTQFVKHELLPAAHEQGWFAARVDLWRNREHPALGLVEALESLAAAERWPGPLRAPLRLAKVKTRLKLPGVEIEGEWEPGTPPAVPADASLETRLAQALHAIAGKAGHALLVLDEFQALAAVDTDNFIAAFRTVMQDLEGRMTFFYTGSSRAALNDMFRKAKAPLFQSAQPMQLPPLDRGFVQSRAEYLERVAGHEVNVDELERVFLALDSTPLFLNEIVLDMLAQNSADIPAAVRRWLEDKRDNQFADKLAAMRALDTAVALWLATPGERSVYTAEARTWMQEFLEGADVSVETPAVQTAVRRLVRANVIEPTGATGEYEFADRAFLVFLRELRGYELLGSLRIH